MEVVSYVPAGEPAFADTREVLESEGCRVLQGWRAFTQAAAGCDCAVIALKEIRAHEESIKLLREWWIQRGRARPPMVLVTPEDAEGLRQLADLDIEGIVFRGSAKESLPLAIRRAMARGFFVQLATRCRAAEHLAPVLCEALSMALLAVPPYRQVEQLALALDVSANDLR